MFDWLPLTGRTQLIVDNKHHNKTHHPATFSSEKHKQCSTFDCPKRYTSPTELSVATLRDATNGR